MSHAGRRLLIVFPLAIMVALCWLVAALAGRLTTYYFVVSVIPFPALLILCCYSMALLWHGSPEGASAVARDQA